MAESFEEWHSKYWGCDTYALDPQVYKNQKNAWDYQQIKIEKLRKDLDKSIKINLCHKTDIYNLQKQNKELIEALVEIKLDEMTTFQRTEFVNKAHEKIKGGGE